MDKEEIKELLKRMANKDENVLGDKELMKRLKRELNIKSPSKEFIKNWKRIDE